MIYEIEPSLLKTAPERFDFQNPPTDPIQLAKDLAETLIAKEGLGLAANQIGLPYRVFAIMASEIIVCFNPIIVDESEEQIVLEEGCLSFPGLSVKVKRPRRIKVRYTEPNGNVVTKVFDGLTARVFMHETSHLNARTMLDDCSYIEKERAQKKLKKLRRMK